MSNIKDNLDIIDEHNMKDVWMHEGVVYSGDTTLINDQTHKEQFISSLLGAAVVGLNNTATPTPNTSKHDKIWTDIDAQEMYLNTKPTCYLILGKSGLGAHTLGEALSKKYNCVHFCPRTVINDELSQGSISGKCLEFNMRHNNPCTYASILPLLQQKIKSPAVRHRGYVISGIPLVSGYRETFCFIQSMHSEEAFSLVDEILFDLIYNLKRKIPKSSAPPIGDNEINNMEEQYNEEEEEDEEKEEEEILEEGSEEEDITPELPKFILNTCSNVFFNVKPFYETRQALALEQLHDLFNLELSPDVIIYITCPDADIITKKYHNYINYKSGQNVTEPFPTKVVHETRWPPKYTITDYENPHANYVFHPKYNCRPPINFNDEIVNQLCNYRKYILPFIEKKIMEYDPKQVIKVDGRTSMYQMMHQISERLLLMDVNAVLVPEPLYLPEPPEDLEEFWEAVEQSQVIRIDDVLSFKHYASPWFSRCPVELKRRQSVIGKPKYAVMLFKHVYIMSSLNNFIAFCRNPRPFLKLQYLEPTCRVIVTGTKSSGKSMIAECLSWIFDTPVTRFNNIYDTEKQKKYDVFAKTIYSEIVPVLEDARYVEWQKKEYDREAKLEEWNRSAMPLLRKYLPLLIESLKYVEESPSASLEEEIEEQEMELEETQLEEEQQERPLGGDMEKEEEENNKRENKKDIEDAEKEILGENQGKVSNVSGKGKMKKVEKIVREKPVPTPEFLKSISVLRERLSFLPILDSVKDCEIAIASGNLLEYAPSELTTLTKKPALPLIGDEDVIKAISEYIITNELQKEIEPTSEELTNEIIKLIITLDTEQQLNTDGQKFYGKYIIDGFPSDSEYWESLSNAKLLPDYTIAIMENREIDPDLMSHYLSVERCIKNHLDLLTYANDPLIVCKRQSKEINIPKDKDVKIIIHDIVNDCFNHMLYEEIDSKSATNIISPEMITSFTESIERFREDWDSIKLKLEEKSKCFIEIELENKTDVEVLEQALLNLRRCYFLQGQTSDNEELDEAEESGRAEKDLLSYNNPQNLCETSIYCPFTYFNYGLLWEGKQEFCLKYDNKFHYFAKEDFLEQFQQDITKYQAYNKPFKMLPKLKICIIGCSGGGLSAISKRIAMELGLIHIHFADIINYYYMPRHYKNVGRKYENHFTDEPMEEEGVVEFQMDEENPNLLADIFSNEKELRRMVYNYYERGQPILPMIMQKIIKTLWFTKPFNCTGFVLDGYPRLPQDVEDLVHCNCIPDIVIEIESNAEIGVERLSPLMFNLWQTQYKDAKAAHKEVIEAKQKIWMSLVTKKTVVKLIMEEILDNCDDSHAPPVKKESLSNTSFVFDAHPTGSTNVDPKLFQIYNELVEKYPKPVDTREWQKPEDVRENINARIEAICETEYENIQASKELLMENKINTISVDGSKPFVKVLRRTLAKLKNLRERNQSMLEQTYIITTDIAEMLLSQGYCFLSRFGRLCPVHVFENGHITQNSYKISKRKGKLFPIIHRAYVYFLCSEENAKKFRIAPLKYVSAENIMDFHPYTIRIGIIGAPKSGRSTLAAKIARRNNLICISRGKAIRNVLETMYWTELGTRIKRKLDNGDLVAPDCVMNAVQTVALDHRTVTYGFVLDGFPASPYEAMVLADSGLYPNIIFDISADKTVVLRNSQNEIHYDILKYMPPYSQPFIEYKYISWQEYGYHIRKWINNDYQNLCSLDGNGSKWQCLQEAHQNIGELTSEIHSYLLKVATEVVPVKIMNISNQLFEKKMSSFRNLCPACLRKNTLRHSGFPVDKNGVVQYRNKFYWICSEHMEWVKKYPDYYLNFYTEVPEIPAVVKIINPENVYENGICIVTYAENLPAQILERGTHKYAAAYKSKTYLCCSEECLIKFLAKPTLYSDITIFKGSSWYHRLSLKKLPDLGYLEQTLANLLTEACCSVNAVRPKYPGLSIELSALLHIALYLKTHNPRLPKDENEFYQKALKMYENRSKLILDIGLRMRSMENPFIAYPRCRHGTTKHLPWTSSSMGSKPSSIDSKHFDRGDKHYPFVGLSKHGDSSRPGFMRSSVATYNDDDDISYTNRYYASSK